MLRSFPPVAWLLTALLVFATCTVFVVDTSGERIHDASWTAQSFYIGVFALLAVVLVMDLVRPPHDAADRSWRAWLPLLILAALPLWAVVQLLTGLTASPIDTRHYALHWGALAAVFYLARRFLADRSARHGFLLLFLAFSVALAVLCLLQLFTSHGLVLWTFDSGYDEVSGTFQSRNNFAQFIELGIPVALWFALRHPRQGWGYTLAAGVLYASVIGTASRAGTVMCTAELVTFMLLALVSSGAWLPASESRSLAVLSFLLVPASALIFSVVVGWDRVWPRFFMPDPYAGRREYLESALQMIRQRPLTGFGLGSYPVIANAFAVKDFPFYSNHVHNDWLEFAADGGIPFLLAILGLFVSRIGAMFRHPWALGLLAVMIHAWVDYPFPRPAISGWMFALLGALFAAGAATSDRDNRTAYAR